MFFFLKVLGAPFLLPHCCFAVFIPCDFSQIFLAFWKLSLRESVVQSESIHSWVAITVYILGYAPTHPEISSESHSVHSVQKSFRWDKEPCKLKVILSVSEFGGLWKHQNIPVSVACTKSVTVSLQNVEVDRMEKEKLVLSHINNILSIIFKIYYLIISCCFYYSS